MQFLVVTRQSAAPPVEMMLPLMDAMDAWLAQHRASGKIAQVWSFAGTGGGGGVVEVDSHEELDEIMGGFPWGPWSEIDIYPLSDLDRSLATNRAVFQQMMGSS